MVRVYLSNRMVFDASVLQREFEQTVWSFCKQSQTGIGEQEIAWFQTGSWAMCSETERYVQLQNQPRRGMIQLVPFQI
jgi:menaquinone-dependent protoporphyrinogen IX oxidase